MLDFCIIKVIIKVTYTTSVKLQYPRDFYWNQM